MCVCVCVCLSVYMSACLYVCMSVFEGRRGDGRIKPNTNSLLQLILKCFFLFINSVVSMNDQSFLTKGQNSFVRDLKVGEPFNISLTLINNSGLLMPPSYLVLDPYQFSEELKRIVKDLRGKMMATSCLVSRIPEVCYPTPLIQCAERDREIGCWFIVHLSSTWTTILVMYTIITLLGAWHINFKHIPIYMYMYKRWSVSYYTHKGSLIKTYSLLSAYHNHCCIGFSSRGRGI